MGNESLRSISTLEKLEELAMVGCSCIDDEGLELLSKGSDALQVTTLWDAKLLYIIVAYYCVNFIM